MHRIQRGLYVTAAALIVSAACGCSRWGWGGLGKFALTDAKLCEKVDAEIGRAHV